MTAANNKANGESGENSATYMNQLSSCAMTFIANVRPAHD